MPARLIVNADDFGLTRGVNSAIAELHAAGALTSATLMATGPALAHAVELAQQHPQLGIGCHIVLTDGVPVLPPEQITTLIGDDGRTLRSSLTGFLLSALRGGIDMGEVQREAAAQIRLLQQAGIRVTHLDTHKHTHVLPRITNALLGAAEQTGVRAIRNPFEAAWSLRLGHTRPVRALSVAATRLFRRRFLAQPAIRGGSVVTTQGTVGISATGLLDEQILRLIVASLPHGVWELVCHPGYNDRELDGVTTRLRQSREVEREALLAVFSQQERARQLKSTSSHPPLPELIHYGRLTHSSSSGRTSS